MGETHYRSNPEVANPYRSLRERWAYLLNIQNPLASPEIREREKNARSQAEKMLIELLYPDAMDGCILDDLQTNHVHQIISEGIFVNPLQELTLGSPPFSISKVAIMTAAAYLNSMIKR